MTSADEERWDRRYRGAVVPRDVTPPEIVATELSAIAPNSRALDIACGLGDAGLAVSQRGCDVTFVDVSDVVLDMVRRRAHDLSLDVQTVRSDLETEPLPKGPWDLIVCTHYLDRAVLGQIGQHLSPGGLALVAIATRLNLERHERPSAKYLLHEGELPSLLPGLRTLRHDERWRTNGVHEAWLAATPP